MPLTVGPGSMSVAIALGSQRPRGVGFEALLLPAAGAIVGMMALAATIYLGRTASRKRTHIGPGADGKPTC